MTLTKKHKNQLIAGLIGVFILTLSLFVKSYYTNKKPENTKQADTPKTIIQTPAITNISKDSSKQTVNQLNQVNRNKGDVKNEFISGDKKTYNTYNQSKNNKKDTIINNGFINNGGTGNTYNQTVSPSIQRHIRQDEMNYFINTYPKEYTYFIASTLGDNETYILGHEIIVKLNQLGFKAKFKGQAVFRNPPFGKINVNVIDSSKTVEMEVFSQSQ